MDTSLEPTAKLHEEEARYHFSPYFQILITAVHASVILVFYLKQHKYENIRLKSTIISRSKKKILPFVSFRVDLKGIMRSEILSYVCNLKTPSSEKQRSDLWSLDAESGE